MIIHDLQPVDVYELTISDNDPAIEEASTAPTGVSSSFWGHGA